MPFQVLEAPARSILSATTGFIAEAGIHAFADARAQLHLRMQLLLRSHHANLWRPEAGRLAALGTVHHVQEQCAGVVAPAAARRSSDLLLAPGGSLSARGGG